MELKMTFLIPSPGHESSHAFFLHLFLFVAKPMAEEEVLT